MFQLHYYTSIAKVWGKIIFVDVVVFSCNANGPLHMRNLGLGKNFVTQNSCKWNCSNFVTYCKFPHLHIKWWKIALFGSALFSWNCVSGEPPVWKNCWAGMNYHCVKYFKHNEWNSSTKCTFCQISWSYRSFDLNSFQTCQN